MTTFALVKKINEETGSEQLALIKKVEGKPDEEWTTMDDLNRLFDSCVARWGSNWDLEKLIVCIRECEFD